MKTQEQQKSELCDEFFTQVYRQKPEDLFRFCKMNQDKYDQITQQKPLSQDPYADEVFSGVMLRLLNRVYSKTNFQISELPHVSWMCKLRGFGGAMKKEYIDVMTNYEMFDKI